MIMAALLKTISELVVFALIIPTLNAILNELSMETLTLTFPSYSYKGAAGIYNNTLYAWNGYECNQAAYSGCGAQMSTTTDLLHTLDISGLTLTSNRRINESSISSTWQTQTLIDPIYVQQSNSASWPSMKTGTPEFTQTADFGWILYPSGGDDRTKIMLKFDFETKQYINTSTYESYPISTSRWSNACNTADVRYVYSIGGRGGSNAVNTAAVYKYDTQTDSWNSLPSLPKSIFGSSCTWLNGNLYSLGGQTDCCATDRITNIYAYNTVNDTGSWGNKIGDLIQPRVGASSFNHPNDWIITVGGRKRNDDDMSAIIEFFDPSNSDINSQTGQVSFSYENKNMYHAMYPYDVDTSILFLWAGYRDPSSNIQSIFNSIKYMVLSTNDALYPTTSPTNTPTLNPTVPTNNPTPAPTDNPTPAPTTYPTPTPTNNPSPAPTNNPTSNPTCNPTVNPTIYPTTYPTLIPTAIPTVITMTPTKTPTFKPSQVPTITPTNVNEGEVQTSVIGDISEEKANIIVNVIQNDVWLAISIVVIAFMAFCFCFLMYWIYRRYNYKKIKRVMENDIDIENNKPNSNSKYEQETDTNKVEMININIKKKEIMNEGIINLKQNGVTNEIMSDENSDSDSSDDKLFGNIETTKGNDPNVTKMNSSSKNDEIDLLYLPGNKKTGKGRALNKMISNDSEALYVVHQEEEVDSPTSPTATTDTGNDVTDM